MIIIGNWKAYIDTPQKAKLLFAAAKKVAGKKGIEIVIAPPAPFLGMLAQGNRSKVSFAAQNVSEVTGGAATGEITAAAAAAAGARFAIVGHSERRARGETDQEILLKAQHALACGMHPILCIGEQERDADAKYLHAVRAQLHAVFSALTQQERTQVIVAYEPIWAIGKTAADAIQPHDLTEMILYIRKVLGDFVSPEAAKHMQVIYGGSVEPANARSLAEGTGIDGFLPGHASTSPAEFTAIVQALQ